MFLTLEDPNAKIKGSRDPLGAQPIWSTFGRHVVTNLTMQTMSTRGFTVLLLGRWLTERLLKDGRIEQEDALDVFLRFEQIAAYARHIGHGVEGEIRGIERVRANLAEHRGRVPIQADPRGFILGDQKVNGLWGLFSVSARVSGLIEYGPVGVTPAAREFAERVYLPRLESVLEPLFRLVARGGRLDTGRPDAVFAAVSGVLPQAFTPAEAAFYGEYLRDGLHVGGATAGRQRTFRDLLEAETDLEAATGRAEVVRLAEAASGIDSGLAHRLERIGRLEAVLAPAMAAFDFVLLSHGRTVHEAAGDLRGRWGSCVPNVDPQAGRDLLPEIKAASSDAVAAAFDRCQRGLAGGDYAAVIEALLEWNAATMHERGGAPWARIGSDGRLDVRYRAADQPVPSGEALATLWRNGYFIDSLKAITHQLRSIA